MTIKTDEAKTMEVGTLYELNQQLMSQLPAQPQSHIQLQFQKIQEWVASHDKQYYMLLCKEKADYTLFNLSSLTPLKREYADLVVENKIRESMIKELKECINNRGFLIAINKAADDAWEFWIKDSITKKVHMYMFFECGPMVIEC